MAEYKECSYSLRKAIKQTKCQYKDKVKLQFNGSDTRCMWQDLQTITDYKGKTSHITNTDVLLPDKLNPFTRFEDNIVPPMRPAPTDCGLSFSVADVRHLSVLTLAKLPAQTAFLAASSEHAQTSWLKGLQTYSIFPYPSLLSPLVHDVHHCSCTQDSKGN